LVFSKSKHAEFSGAAAQIRSSCGLATRLDDYLHPTKHNSAAPEQHCCGRFVCEESNPINGVTRARHRHARPTCTILAMRPDSGAEFAFDRFARPSQEQNMPNRGELAIPVTRLRRNAVEKTDARAADFWASDAWAIVGICVIGALVSIYFAVNFQSFDGLPMVIGQIPLG
jgi:hypothetical protein